MLPPGQVDAVNAVSRLGATLIATAEELGGMLLLLGSVLRCLVPPSLDGRELWRNLYRMGVRSVPIVILTAFFVGGIMVIQAGIFVRRLGAHGLVGWGTGYAVFREVGPILIALMFSGRVGANNTAELGTMTVTEQIDGLRALAIDPVRYLLVPRVLSMVGMLFLLTVVGDAIAIGGAALFARLLLGVEWATFINSFVDNLALWDLWHGLLKALVFGLTVAVTSCHFGVTVRGGAVGVGRAVNAAVVAAAVGIMCLDFLLTSSLG